MVCWQERILTVETSTRRADYGSFGSLPWRSSSAQRPSAKASNQSRDVCFSAAAAILIRKKVSSGTLRRLNTLNLGFLARGRDTVRMVAERIRRVNAACIEWYHVIQCTI